MQSKTIVRESTAKLNQMLKDLNLGQVKASSEWSKNMVKSKEAGLHKSISKRGDKTSLQKDIRRNIARIKTELRRREIENER